MIKGVHAMFYSPQAEELRAFFRDKLRLPYVDTGEGWLIFRPLEGEIGFHPVDHLQTPPSEPPAPNTQYPPSISLYCDDIHATVAELKERGVEFTQEVEDWGYGIGTFLTAPGGLVVQLYQPRYL